MLRLYTGTEPLKVPVLHLFAVLRAIERTGEADRFLALCAAQHALVTLTPNLVNLSKTFLDSKAGAASDPEALEIIACDAGRYGVTSD